MNPLINNSLSSFIPSTPIKPAAILTNPVEHREKLNPAEVKAISEKNSQEFSIPPKYEYDYSKNKLSPIKFTINEIIDFFNSNPLEGGASDVDELYLTGSSASAVLISSTNPELAIPPADDDCTWYLGASYARYYDLILAFFKTKLVKLNCVYNSHRDFVSAFESCYLTNKMHVPNTFYLIGLDKLDLKLSPEQRNHPISNTAYSDGFQISLRKNFAVCVHRGRICNETDYKKALLQTRHRIYDMGDIKEVWALRNLFYRTVFKMTQGAKVVESATIFPLIFEKMSKESTPDFFRFRFKNEFSKHQINHFEGNQQAQMLDCLNAFSLCQQGMEKTKNVANSLFLDLNKGLAAYWIERNVTLLNNFVRLVDQYPQSTGHFLNVVFGIFFYEHMRSESGQKKITAYQFPFSETPVDVRMQYGMVTESDNKNKKGTHYLAMPQEFDPITVCVEFIRSWKFIESHVCVRKTDKECFTELAKNLGVSKLALTDLTRQSIVNDFCSILKTPKTLQLLAAHNKDEKNVKIFFEEILKEKDLVNLKNHLSILEYFATSTSSYAPLLKPITELRKILLKDVPTLAEIHTAQSLLETLESHHIFSDKEKLEIQAFIHTNIENCIDQPNLDLKLIQAVLGKINRQHEAGSKIYEKLVAQALQVQKHQSVDQRFFMLWLRLKTVSSQNLNESTRDECLLFLQECLALESSKGYQTAYDISAMLLPFAEDMSISHGIFKAIQILYYHSQEHATDSLNLFTDLYKATLPELQEILRSELMNLLHYSLELLNTLQGEPGNAINHIKKLLKVICSTFQITLPSGIQSNDSTIDAFLRDTVVIMLKLNEPFEAVRALYKSPFFSKSLSQESLGKTIVTLLDNFVRDENWMNAKDVMQDIISAKGVQPPQFLTELISKSSWWFNVLPVKNKELHDSFLKIVLYALRNDVYFHERLLKSDKENIAVVNKALSALSFLLSKRSFSNLANLLIDEARKHQFLITTEYGAYLNLMHLTTTPQENQQTTYVPNQVAKIVHNLIDSCLNNKEASNLTNNPHTLVLYALQSIIKLKDLQSMELLVDINNYLDQVVTQYDAGKMTQEHLKMLLDLFTDTSEGNLELFESFNLQGIFRQKRALLLIELLMVYRDEELTKRFSLEKIGELITKTPTAQTEPVYVWRNLLKELSFSNTLSILLRRSLKGFIPQPEYNYVSLLMLQRGSEFGKELVSELKKLPSPTHRMCALLNILTLQMQFSSLHVTGQLPQNTMLEILKAVQQGMPTLLPNILAFAIKHSDVYGLHHLFNVIQGYIFLDSIKTRHQPNHTVSISKGAKELSNAFHYRDGNESLHVILPVADKKPHTLLMRFFASRKILESTPTFDEADLKLLRQIPLDLRLSSTLMFESQTLNTKSCWALAWPEEIFKLVNEGIAKFLPASSSSIEEWRTFCYIVASIHNDNLSVQMSMYQRGLSLFTANKEQAVIYKEIHNLLLILSSSMKPKNILNTLIKFCEHHQNNETTISETIAAIPDLGTFLFNQFKNILQKSSLYLNSFDFLSAAHKIMINPFARFIFTSQKVVEYSQELLQAVHVSGMRSLDHLCNLLSFLKDLHNYFVDNSSVKLSEQIKDTQTNLKSKILILVIEELKSELNAENVQKILTALQNIPTQTLMEEKNLPDTFNILTQLIHFALKRTNSSFLIRITNFVTQVTELMLHNNCASTNEFNTCLISLTSELLNPSDRLSMKPDTIQLYASMAKSLIKFLYHVPNIAVQKHCNDVLFDSVFTCIVQDQENTNTENVICLIQDLARLSNITTPAMADLRMMLVRYSDASSIDNTVFQSFLLQFVLVWISYSPLKAFEVLQKPNLKTQITNQKNDFLHLEIIKACHNKPHDAFIAFEAWTLLANKAITETSYFDKIFQESVHILEICLSKEFAASVHNPSFYTAPVIDYILRVLNNPFAIKNLNSADLANFKHSTVKVINLLLHPDCNLEEAATAIYKSAKSSGMQFDSQVEEYIKFMNFQRQLVLDASKADISTVVSKSKENTSDQLLKMACACIAQFLKDNNHSNLTLISNILEQLNNLQYSRKEKPEFAELLDKLINKLPTLPPTYKAEVQLIASLYINSHLMIDSSTEARLSLIACSTNFQLVTSLLSKIENTITQNELEKLISTLCSVKSKKLVQFAFALVQKHKSLFTAQMGSDLLKCATELKQMVLLEEITLIFHNTAVADTQQHIAAILSSLIFLIKNEPGDAKRKNYFAILHQFIKHMPANSQIHVDVLDLHIKFHSRDADSTYNLLASDLNLLPCKSLMNCIEQLMHIEITNKQFDTRFLSIVRYRVMPVYAEKLICSDYIADFVTQLKQWSLLKTDAHINLTYHLLHSCFKHLRDQNQMVSYISTQDPLSAFVAKFLFLLNRHDKSLFENLHEAIRPNSKVSNNFAVDGSHTEIYTDPYLHPEALTSEDPTSAWAPPVTTADEPSFPQPEFALPSFGATVCAEPSFALASPADVSTPTKTFYDSVAENVKEKLAILSSKLLKINSQNIFSNEELIKKFIDLLTLYYNHEPSMIVSITEHLLKTFMTVHEFDGEIQIKYLKIIKTMVDFVEDKKLNEVQHRSFAALWIEKGIDVIRFNINTTNNLIDASLLSFILSYFENYVSRNFSNNFDIKTTSHLLKKFSISIVRAIHSLEYQELLSHFLSIYKKILDQASIETIQIYRKLTSDIASGIGSFPFNFMTSISSNELRKLAKISQAEDTNLLSSVQTNSDSLIKKHLESIYLQLVTTWRDSELVKKYIKDLTVSSAIPLSFENLTIDRLWGTEEDMPPGFNQREADENEFKDLARKMIALKAEQTAAATAAATTAATTTATAAAGTPAQPSNARARRKAKRQAKTK